MPDDPVIVKLDFTNAFNSLHRDAMLEAVSPRVPAIYTFCYVAYNQPSVVKIFEHRIIYEEGHQQGDLVGGLLFYNTIHPLLRRMNSNFVEGYMHDIMLGGKSDTVADDVATIRTLGSTLGLHLNAKKCELIQHCPTTIEHAFRDFVITSKENATLLDASLTDGRAQRSVGSPMRRPRQSHRQTQPAAGSRRPHPSEVFF